MIPTLRRAFLTVAMLAVLAGRADALTIRDIIELTRAGLGDEVLLALIEVDRGVYAIDTATLKQLKEAGVSDKVIVALVRSGRELPAAPPPPMVTDADAPAPQPQVVVIEHHDPQPERVREVHVAVPVYIPVRSRARHHRGDYAASSSDTSNFVPFQSGPPAHREEPRKAEPVYWGFGGKLRPDSWDPGPGARPHDRKK
jgi:hypothetical protein